MGPKVSCMFFTGLSAENFTCFTILAVTDIRIGICFLFRMLQMLNPLRGSLRICCYKPKATQRQFSSKHHKHPESSDFNFGEFMKLVQLKDYEKYRVPKLPIGKSTSFCKYNIRLSFVPRIVWFR